MNQKDQYYPHWSEGISPSDFEQVVIEMEREIHELKGDAERYRWLRQNDNHWGQIEMHHSAKYPECMDLVIDTLKGKQND